MDADSSRSSRSQAPAWERTICEAPASRPSEAGASEIPGSQAGAWEPDQAVRGQRSEVSRRREAARFAEGRGTRDERARRPGPDLFHLTLDTRPSTLPAASAVPPQSQLANPKSQMLLLPLPSPPPRASMAAVTGNLATAPRICTSRPHARQTLGDRRPRSSMVAARHAARGKYKVRT